MKSGLPKSNDALVRVLDAHVHRASEDSGYRRLMEGVYYRYLNGARHFSSLSPTTGKFKFSYVDKKGNLQFHNSELLKQVDEVIGSYMAMDFHPAVDRVDSSLSSIQDKARAQVLLDSILPPSVLEQAVKDYLLLFVVYGGAGLAAKVVNDTAHGLTADLEVIHPRELLPFPCLDIDHTKQTGVMRRRYVRVDWLKEKVGAKAVETNRYKLDSWLIPMGEAMHMDKELGDNSLFFGGVKMATPERASQQKQEKITEDMVEVCEIRELWLWRTNARILTAYVAQCGDWIITRKEKEYQDSVVYSPVSYERMIHSGDFYGQGLCDLLFNVNRESERLQAQLFKNATSIDKYGFVLVPHGQFDPNAIHSTEEGLRFYFYSPDPFADNTQRPVPIAPFNSGDVPGRTASFAREIQNALKPRTDIIDDKGRVDSASGLALLDEQVNRSMNAGREALARIFGDAYRSLLQQAVTELSGNKEAAVPVSYLNEAMVGVVIDPDTDQASFGDNPIREIHRLKFTVRSSLPRSESARKAEALELLEKGVSSREQFILYALREGLEMGMYMQHEANAYRKIVRNILLLFRDGEKPGEVMTTTQSDLPALELTVLNAFMASPEFLQASPEVQNAFADYQDHLMGSMGMLPEGTPNPDDAALLAVAQQQAAQSEASRLINQMVTPGAVA